MRGGVSGVMIEGVGSIERSVDPKQISTGRGGSVLLSNEGALLSRGGATRQAPDARSIAPERDGVSDLEAHLGGDRGLGRDAGGHLGGQLGLRRRGADGWDADG